jgi:hypothetical protein
MRSKEMVFSSNFVVCVKVGKSFLRDNENIVKLPFGSEYSLYLKNLESRDAVVKVSIDGKDVLDNHEIIVRSKEFVELEGFLEGMSVKNKFKFIELTKEIEDYRKYGPEDSLIRVEIKYQKPKPIIQEIKTIYASDWKWEYPHYNWEHWQYSDNNTHVYKGMGTSHTTSNSGESPIQYSCYNLSSNDIGITVKGQETSQNFGIGYAGDLEENSHVIILKLSGYKEDKTEVKQFITTKEKIKCSTCGKENSSENKFCPKCGTFIG